MNTDNLNYDDVVIEKGRHKDKQYTMVTVLIYIDGVNIEAYDRSECNIEDEMRVQDKILRLLGFNKDFIRMHNGQ